MTSTLRGEGERELVQRYAEARTRLTNAPPRPDTPVRSMPESPFRRAVREARAEQVRIDREIFDRQVETLAPPRSPHWYQIVCEVAKKRGLNPREIISRDRTREIVHARHECWWRMRREITVLGEPISLPVIGRKFGNMDHTTVLWGVNQHERRMRGECPDRRGGPGRESKKSATGVNEQLTDASQAGAA